MKYLIKIMNFSDMKIFLFSHLNLNLNSNLHMKNFNIFIIELFQIFDFIVDII